MDGDKGRKRLYGPLIQRDLADADHSIPAPGVTDRVHKLVDVIFDNMDSDILIYLIE